MVKKIGVFLMTVGLLACSSTPTGRAPIVEISAIAAHSGTEINGRYAVKQGENLYRIALDHGVAYRDLARWNNITHVDDIKTGQVLRLSGPEESSGVVATGISNATVQTKPLAKEPVNASQPMVANTPAAVSDDTLVLRWPAEGKISVPFAKNGKGIDMVGKLGQAIIAAADGSVVYSGTGLRGYGKLVIVKHNKVYLTAYAHNNKLLVKEGDVVKKGQKIAEMGSTDTDKVKLHFEVRRFGKPVDPAKYLT